MNRVGMPFRGGKRAIVTGAGQGIGRGVALLKQNPKGRIGAPEQDIGSAGAFPCGEGGGYMTGNTAFLDRGSHINDVSWQVSAG